MNTKTIPILVSILLFIPGFLTAEEKNPKETGSLSIADVLNMARENNPAIHGARKKWEAEKRENSSDAIIPRSHADLCYIQRRASDKSRTT